MSAKIPPASTTSGFLSPWCVPVMVSYSSVPMERMELRNAGRRCYTVAMKKQSFAGVASDSVTQPGRPNFQRFSRPSNDRHDLAGQATPNAEDHREPPRPTQRSGGAEASRNANN